MSRLLNTHSYLTSTIIMSGVLACHKPNSLVTKLITITDLIIYIIHINIISILAAKCYIYTFGYTHNMLYTSVAGWGDTRAKCYALAAWWLTQESTPLGRFISPAQYHGSTPLASYKTQLTQDTIINLSRIASVFRSFLTPP